MLLMCLLFITRITATTTTMSLESWISTANELLQRHAAMGALPPTMTPALMLNRTRAHVLHDVSASFRAHVYWRALSSFEDAVVIEEPTEIQQTDVASRVMKEWKTRGFTVVHVPRESKYILLLR